MKLFVDTGSIKEIEAIAALGILDGVTTNPSLLAKESGDFRQNLKRICEIVNGPVSGEVTATDSRRHAAAGPRHREDSPAHGRQGAADARTASRRARRCRAKAFASTSRSSSRRPRRCWRPRPAPPSSARSSDGSTTSATNGMELIREIVEIYDNYEFRDRGARRQLPPSDSHRRGRADGRRHLHLSARRHRAAVQPPADQHRAREVPEGLGESRRR